MQHISNIIVKKQEELKEQINSLRKAIENPAMSESQCSKNLIKYCEDLEKQFINNDQQNATININKIINKIEFECKKLNDINAVLNSYINYFKDIYPIISAKTILSKEQNIPKINAFYIKKWVELENQMEALLQCDNISPLISNYDKIVKAMNNDVSFNQTVNFINENFDEDFKKALPSIIKAIDPNKMDREIRITKGTDNFTMQELKNALLYEINDYINKSYTTENREKNSGATSIRRQQQIGSIVKKINNAQNRYQLISDISSYLSSSFHTFESSQLKNKLESVNNKYKIMYENKHKMMKSHANDSTFIMIDLNKPITLTNKKLLNTFLKKYDNQAFFDANQIYEMNGIKFKLSHHLLRRKRKLPLPDGSSKLQTKYDALSFEPFAYGANGMVFTVNKSLTLTDQSLRESDDDKHIVKMTAEFNKDSYANKKFEFSGKLIINVTHKKGMEQERLYQQYDNRLRPKELEIYEDDDNLTLFFLTNRKFKGKTLEQEIADLKHQPQDEKLHLRRYQLSITALSALDEQVMQHELIHRDIKPGNMIVDSSSSQTNIIDAGLCIELKEKDSHHYAGTKSFASPEAFLGDHKGFSHYHQKSDICSMGISLGKLWGNKNYEFNNAKDNNKNAIGLHAHKELKYDTSQNVAKIIKKMTCTDPDQRDSIDILKQKFIHAYIEAKYTKYNTKEREQLSASYNQGMKLRDELRRVSNSDDKTFQFRSLEDGLRSSNHLLQIHLTIQDDVKDHDKASIHEFTQGLGWHCVKDVDSKSELFNKFNVIIHNYYHEIDKYKLILDSAKTYLENSQLALDDAARIELEEFIGEIQLKFDRIRDKQPFDLDYIVQGTESLNNKYHYYQNQLSAMTKYAKEYKQGQIVGDGLSQHLLQPISAHQKNQIIASLKTQLQSIASDPDAVAAFSCGLGWNHVQSINNADDLIKRIESVFDKNEIKQKLAVDINLIKLIKHVDKLFPLPYYKNELPSFKKYCQEKLNQLQIANDFDDIHTNEMLILKNIKNMINLINEMERYLRYSSTIPELANSEIYLIFNLNYKQLCSEFLKMWQQPMMPTEISDKLTKFVNNNYTQAILKLSKYKEILSNKSYQNIISAKKPVKAKQVSSVLNLQNNLYYGMKKYLKDAAKNHDKISEQRQKEIKEIASCVRKNLGKLDNFEKMKVESEDESPSQSKELTELKNKISNIETSFFFGRSDLKKNLQEIIENYEQTLVHKK